MAHDFENARVEPKVLRRTAAGNHQRLVIAGPNFVKGRIQSEIVTALLAVSLVSLEVVDRRPDRIARALLRTDGIDGVAHHQERLKRNHHFVIFHIIANQHEDLLGSHDERSPHAIVARL